MKNKSLNNFKNQQMKKLFVFIICCLFLSIMNINAQREFKPFRVDIGFGTGSGVVNQYQYLLFNIEPKYAIFPQMSVGFKLEGGSGKIQTFESYMVTADYSIFPYGWRPFLGFGLGNHKIWTLKSDSDTDLSSCSNFGAMIRAGIDFRHLRVCIAYDFAGKNALGDNSGFTSITLGVYIGGGKVKRE